MTIVVILPPSDNQCNFSMENELYGDSDDQKDLSDLGAPRNQKRVLRKYCIIDRIFRQAPGLTFPKQLRSNSLNML